MKTFLVIAFACVIANAANVPLFECPDDLYGFFPDEEQCDKYYDCQDGEATEVFCPDGLVFDPHIRKVNKCDLPINVNCEGRLLLQPPQPGPKCPRKYGSFAHPDPGACGVYYDCINGVPTEKPCTPGTYFDENTGLCIWPADSNRTGCHAPKNKLADGFECPAEETVDGFGVKVTHPTFAHPDDCQKFYVCLNNIEPRELQCQEAEVFNDISKKCDSPDNVEGCEDWYKSDDELTPEAASRSRR